ncbi:MAG: GTP--adenosylcobinamide-phosphate guanylyltransferase [Methanosphaera stadtmanae]|jgi:adenosylcobinamide-phosphate guanylyltransferase|nr:GTP--adenosylcobinamide-phosphate guanylyltransferase [Methanosphaera stadtmanae]
MTTALVMAGGLGTRMDLDIEKPLIILNGKPMIEYVVRALLESKYVDNILVAVSPNTPNTKEFLKKFPVTVIETSAKGYIEDLSEVLSNRKYVKEDEVIMTIVADLPFVTAQHIDEVLETYYSRNKPAMCVSVPEKLFNEYGIKPTLVFDGLVPSGVNMLIANTQEQDQTIYITEHVELAFNINTVGDLNLSKNYNE